MTFTGILNELILYTQTCVIICVTMPLSEQLHKNIIFSVFCLFLLSGYSIQRRSCSIHIWNVIRPGPVPVFEVYMHSPCICHTLPNVVLCTVVNNRKIISIPYVCLHDTVQLLSIHHSFKCLILHHSDVKLPPTFFLDVRM